MENQEQTKVLCVRTIDGVNIPVTRIRQLYLKRPEKPGTLVGEMRFCAVIGEQEDSAFHYFDPEDCIKFRMHDTCRVYDDSMHFDWINRFRIHGWAMPIEEEIKEVKEK